MRGPGAERRDGFSLDLARSDSCDFGDPIDAKGLDQTVDTTHRGTLQVTLSDDCDQGRFGASTRLQQPVWEVAAATQLGIFSSIVLTHVSKPHSRVSPSVACPISPERPCLIRPSCSCSRALVWTRRRIHGGLH
jgi:hypothetical protein